MTKGDDPYGPKGPEDSISKFLNQFSPVQHAARLMHMYLLHDEISAAIVTKRGAPVEEFRKAMDQFGDGALWLPAEHSLQNELSGDEGREHKHDTLRKVREYIASHGFSVIAFYDTDFRSEVGEGTSNIFPELKKYIGEQRRLQPSTRYLSVVAMGPEIEASEANPPERTGELAIADLFIEWYNLQSTGLTTTLKVPVEKAKGAEYSPEMAEEIKRNDAR